MQYVLALACHSSIPININDSVVIPACAFFPFYFIHSFVCFFFIVVVVALLFFFAFSVQSSFHFMYEHCEMDGNRGRVKKQAKERNI